METVRFTSKGSTRSNNALPDVVIQKNERGDVAFPGDHPKTARGTALNVKACPLFLGRET